jgi:hypothetical protein
LENQNPVGPACHPPNEHLALPQHRGTMALVHARAVLTLYLISFRLHPKEIFPLAAEQAALLSLVFALLLLASMPRHRASQICFLLLLSLSCSSSAHQGRAGRRPSFLHGRHCPCPFLPWLATQLPPTGSSPPCSNPPWCPCSSPWMQPLLLSSQTTAAAACQSCFALWSCFGSDSEIVC